MDIDNLTIGEVKNLANLFSGSRPASESLQSRYVGRYVICRSRNEGINAGKVIAADDTGVILEDARRLWYHKPANKNLSWYEGVAESGLSDDSRAGNPVEKIITEDYSLIVCNKKAENSIREAISNEQN